MPMFRSSSRGASSLRGLSVAPAVTLVLPWLLCVAVSPAHADIDFKFSGYISSDIRFRVLADER